MLAISPSLSPNPFIKREISKQEPQVSSKNLSNASSSPTPDSPL